ncbi:MAG: ribosomal L7Ae/L30e/S12e/Gadd45 family protein [Bacillota bacterium]
MARPSDWLGLARRSGRAAIGRQACRQALHGGRAVLVVTAQDGSPGARRYWQGAARRAGIRIVTWGTRQELGQALGMGAVTVVAICDRDLASNFLAAVSGCTMRAVAGRSGVMGIEEDSSLSTGEGAERRRQASPDFPAEPGQRRIVDPEHG